MGLGAKLTKKNPLLKTLVEKTREIGRSIRTECKTQVIARYTLPVSLGSGDGRVAILYNYHETPQSYRNASHMVRYGMFPLPEVDYFVITNSKKRRLKFPKHVKIIYRDSSWSRAWGGWQLCLSKLKIKDYNYFILLKDTALGPHPSAGPLWMRQFTRMITPNCKLVGPTINMFQEKVIKPHVQAYCLCTDQIGIRAIIDDRAFDYGDLDRGDTGEIMASRSILRRGYNLACRLPQCRGIDFRSSKLNLLSKCLYIKDPYAPGSHITVDYPTVIFVRNK